MKRADSVLLLSGGLDSGILLAKEISEGRHPAAISFQYGSKHNARELDAANKLSSIYRVSQRVVSLGFISELLTSSLLAGGAELPTGHYTEESVKQTVVPFRNGIFLSIATALADELGASRVLIASHANDYAVYPDCRPEFSAAFSKASELGTDSGVRVEAPFATFSKRDIALLGSQLNFDFSLTWSCYAGGKVHCGSCSTCNERKAALGFSEGRDPTVYESSPT